MTVNEDNEIKQPFVNKTTLSGSDDYNGKIN